MVIVSLPTSYKLSKRKTGYLYSVETCSEQNSLCQRAHSVADTNSFSNALDEEWQSRNPSRTPPLSRRDVKTMFQQLSLLTMHIDRRMFNPNMRFLRHHIQSLQS